MEGNDQLIDEALRKSAVTLEENYPAGLLPATDIWAAINAKRERRHVSRIQKWSAAATLLLLATAITIWLMVKKEAGLPIVRHQMNPIEMPATENEARA